MQINELKLESEEQRNNIRRANELYSLGILKQGLNDNLTSIIFSAQPKAFNEAFNLDLEVETQIQSKVMFYKTEKKHSWKNKYYNDRNNLFGIDVTKASHTHDLVCSM